MAKRNSASILRQMEHVFRTACPTSHLRAAQVVGAHQGHHTTTKAVVSELEALQGNVRSYTMPDGSQRTVIVS